MKRSWLLLYIVSYYYLFYSSPLGVCGPYHDLDTPPGVPELFYNCADISIQGGGDGGGFRGSSSPTTLTLSPPTSAPVVVPVPSTPNPDPTTPAPTLGLDHLEKIIQLPYRLPPVKKQTCVGLYLNTQMGMLQVESPEEGVVKGRRVGSSTVIFLKCWKRPSKTRQRPITI
jgi:hypothetical protein